MAIPLDFLRGVAEQFLPDTCTIRRYTETTSGDGTVQSWADLATGVPCRVSPVGRTASPEAIGASGGVQAASQWTIYMPAGQDVTERDRVVVGSRTFEVSEVVARSYEASRSVICREIT